MEFDLYKENRTAEIKARYASRFTTILTRYNRSVAGVNLTRFAINKPWELARLRMVYDSDFRTITSQMNSEISRIVMPVPINVSKSTKKALLIGINYIGTVDELNGCIHDAENIASKLIGFKTITALTDYTTVKPTKANILREFTKLLSTAVSGDCLLFTFSGHGSQVNDKNGDEVDGKDEGLFTIDEKLIVDDDLNLIIKRYLKPGVTLFALTDCCHSGTIMDLKYNYIDYLENPKNTETGGNVIMISGCKDEQTSADAYINGKSQGAMTWAFLGNLQPDITWRKLVENMCFSLKESGYTQIPKLSSGKFINPDSKFLFA
jgi:metacaspase-1